MPRRASPRKPPSHSREVAEAYGHPAPVNLNVPLFGPVGALLTIVATLLLTAADKAATASLAPVTTGYLALMTRSWWWLYAIIGAVAAILQFKSDWVHMTPSQKLSLLRPFLLVSLFAAVLSLLLRQAIDLASYFAFSQHSSGAQSAVFFISVSSIGPLFFSLGAATAFAITRWSSRMYGVWGTGMALLFSLLFHDLVPVSLPKPSCSGLATISVASAALAATAVGKKWAWYLAAAWFALVAGHWLSCWVCVMPAYSIGNGAYKVLFACECQQGGHVAVVSGWLHGDYKYELMKMDHSILGGRYSFPADIAGQSVYDAFYLQDAVWLFNKNGTTLLNVGLGIGFAAQAMQLRGVEVDVVELHSEVVVAARRFFDYQPNGRVNVGDAVWVVNNTLSKNPALQEHYDFVIHDVFSGGGVESNLFTPQFFRSLRRLLSPNGVIAVSYVGPHSGCLNYIAGLLTDAFGKVRLFKDDLGADVLLKNYVFFASAEDLRLAKPTTADIAHDPQRGEMFFYLQKHEVELPVQADTPGEAEYCFGANGSLGAQLVETASLHWKLMEKQFPGEFWQRSY